MFIKYVPGTRDVSVPVFASGACSACAAGPLRRSRLRSRRLDGIRDNAPLSAADSEAFYRLLVLTGTAEAARLLYAASLLECARRGGTV